MTVPADIFYAVKAPALGCRPRTSNGCFKFTGLEKGTDRGQAPLAFQMFLKRAQGTLHDTQSQ